MSTWASIMWRSAVVLTSAAVFIACLTQIAFVSPGIYFEQLSEISVESMNELWRIGWMGLPIALVSFFVPNPLVFVSIVAAGVFAYKKWRIAAVVAALFARGLSR